MTDHASASASASDDTRVRRTDTAAGLSVAIRRRVGDFTLQVAFETGRGITALLGASGAGKTLTLRAIAGLLRPDEGRIALDDRVLFDAQARVDLTPQARRVGYVFQHYAVFPHLTVAQNIGYGLHTLPRADRATRVTEMLELVGLPDFSARRPATLSGGQLQRVALARAMAPRPSLLLLDEPLAALDAPLRRRLGAELRALHERMAIPMVLVTHDPDEARHIADAVLTLDAGHVQTSSGG
jgi:ABC-type sulfate/molybdate transport systems ATPase subunit